MFPDPTDLERPGNYSERPDDDPDLLRPNTTDLDEVVSEIENLKYLIAAGQITTSDAQTRHTIHDLIRRLDRAQMQVENELYHLSREGRDAEMKRAFDGPAVRVIKAVLEDEDQDDGTTRPCPARGCKGWMRVIGTRSDVRWECEQCEHTEPIHTPPPDISDQGDLEHGDVYEDH